MLINSGVFHINDLTLWIIVCPSVLVCLLGIWTLLSVGIVEKCALKELPLLLGLGFPRCFLPFFGLHNIQIVTTCFFLM